MTITEKILHDNANEIKLYKEGIFWVAYEQSAYYIWQKKGYKATKKLIKTLGQEIMSVGFPQSSYETFTHTFDPVLEKDEAYFKIFSLDKAIDMDAFQQWKAHMPGRDVARRISTAPAMTEIVPEQLEMQESSKENRIYQKLYDFPLENKTPMECMVFLSEIKKICYSHGNL